MINFRYHIVSLMAVFIALSVGIAVGVSLSPSVDQGLLQQAAQDRKQVTDLQNAMAKLISDAGNMAVKSAKEATGDVASQVGAAASNIADKSSEMAQAASEQAKTFASELEKVARANPLGALAGALLAGVVIGLIGRSRS